MPKPKKKLVTLIPTKGKTEEEIVQLVMQQMKKKSK